MKKKLLIIFLIFILIVIVICVLVIKRDKQNLVESKKIDYSNLKVANISKEDLINSEKEIKNNLNIVEKEYQESKLHYDGYNRRDFYGGQRINQNTENLMIDFVTKYDVDLTKIYNLNGEKINNINYETFNKLVLKNKSVEENENTLDFKIGKNYLLRAYYYSKNICLYYIVNFSQTGVNEIDLAFYTEDEIVDNYLNEAFSSDTPKIEH